ncbi:MAG TPA: hypothetical protein PKI78_09795, partial [Anaerolineales bacterium]|nr:hypothetical protein [Anaerolineales bacterium]
MTVGVTLEAQGVKLLDQVNLEVEVEPQLEQFTLNVPVLPNYAGLPPSVRYTPTSDGDTIPVKVLAGGTL